jgi:hypothetical protein
MAGVKLQAHNLQDNASQRPRTSHRNTLFRLREDSQKHKVGERLAVLGNQKVGSPVRKCPCKSVLSKYDIH